MKPLSASIIVLAAAFMITNGAQVGHTDTRLFIIGVGSFVGIAGLFGWFIGFTEKLVAARPLHGWRGFCCALKVHQGFRSRKAHGMLVRDHGRHP